MDVGEERNARIAQVELKFLSGIINGLCGIGKGDQWVREGSWERKGGETRFLLCDMVSAAPLVCQTAFVSYTHTHTL